MKVYQLVINFKQKKKKEKQQMINRNKMVACFLNNSQINKLVLKDSVVFN